VSAVAGSGAKDLKLEDFMAKFGPQDEEEADTSANRPSMLQSIKNMNARMGGRVKKR
jgi:hypothetical protein